MAVGHYRTCGNGASRTVDEDVVAVVLVDAVDGVDVVDDLVDRRVDN